MKKTVYREVDFATALYERTHKAAVVEIRARGASAPWIIPTKLLREREGSAIDFDCMWSFRIVTEIEPKYREYKKIEEVPVGKIATYTTMSGVSIRGVLGAICYEACKSPEIHIGEATFSAKEALERGRFYDGSPCWAEVVE